MNLYAPADHPGGPLAPADWTMTVGLGGTGEGAFYYADIDRAGTFVCRLVVTGERSEQEARRILAVKARLWIDDYLSRAHTGTTAFGSLE